MKLIAIGDIHGRRAWKQVPFASYDRAVFLGDYCDSKEFTDDAIFRNLGEIVALREAMPDRVTLLLGNHDAHYLFYPSYRCSGFRPSMCEALVPFFRRHRPLFRAAFQERDYLFTHAGVSGRWLRRHRQALAAHGYAAPPDSLAGALNAMLDAGAHDALLEVGPARGGPAGQAGGILWADRSETMHDYLPGYHQVVGHSPVPGIRYCGDAGGSIAYIDVLGQGPVFFEKSW